MTSKNDGPGKGPAKPTVDPAQPRKPAAIIDLKATEIGIKDTAGATSPGAKPGETAKSAPSATAAAADTAKPDATKQQPSATASTGAAKPAQPAKPPAAAPAPRRTSFGSIVTHTLAGLVGGFLALVGADSISSQLGLGGPQAGLPAPDVERRLAALEQTSSQRPGAAVPADVAQKVASVEARLAAVDELAKAVKALGENQTALAGEAKAIGERVAAAQSDDAGARLARLEATLAALSASAAGDPDKAGRLPQLAAVTGQIRDLESSVDAKVAALRKSVGQELDNRLGPLTEASTAAQAGTQRLDRDVASVGTETTRLTQRVDGLKGDSDRLAQSVKTLEDNSAALTSSMDALKADVAQQLRLVARPQDIVSSLAPVASKLATVEQSIDGVVKSEADRKANAERIVLALELGNLKRAIDRGGAFAAELAEVQRLGGSRLDLGPLEKVKSTGVPTTAELAKEFRPVAHAAIEADSVPADASVMEQLLSGAKSIVRVRKVSAGPDDKSAEAIVARMEAALRDQRFAAVVDESKQLSARGQAAVKDWLARLEARAAVERAVAKAEADLKSALGGKS